MDIPVGPLFHYRIVEGWPTIRPLKLDQEQTVPRLLLRVGKSNMERLSVRRKRRERRIGSVGMLRVLLNPGGGGSCFLRGVPPPWGENGVAM